MKSTDQNSASLPTAPRAPNHKPHQHATAAANVTNRNHSATTSRPKDDPQNPQHFKGLQSNSKQMSGHKSVRSPHLDVPRQTTPIRANPQLSAAIHAKKWMKGHPAVSIAFRE
jgi:hypothetical protein